MSNCYKCGSNFSGYGSVCPTCKQTEALKEQSERALRSQQATALQLREDARRQNELMEAQLEVSRQHATAQLEISRLQAKAQIASEQFKAQEIAKQTEQAEIQTRLLLEQSISNDDAYRQGYNLESFIQLDPNNPNFEVLHHHDLCIGLKESGEVYAGTIEPDFITPKLKKAYFDGVTERLRKDFSERISLDYLKQKAYEAGLNECTIHQVQDTGGEFNLSYGEEGTGIKFTTALYHPGVSYTANKISGKLEPGIENEHIFENPDLNDAFKKGLIEYLKSENSPLKCQSRLEKLEAHAQLIERKKSEYQRKVDEYNAAFENWRKREARLPMIEYSFIGLLLLLLLGLIFTGHWITSIAFLVLCIIFMGRIGALIDSLTSSLSTNCPIKPEMEAIPELIIDDDPLYDEAVRLVNEGLPPSPSLLQLKLRIGYKRATKMLSTMENMGLVASRDR